MKTPSQRLDWALAVCGDLHVRLTPVRQSLLEFLANQRVPASLNTVLSAEGVHGRCDATTAYRSLMLFKEIEVIRRVALPGKAGFYVLNVPGENFHFLICRTCGAIAELPSGDHCESLQREVAAAHGYAQLYHELQFFGICPACQKKPRRTLCAKLPVSTRRQARPPE